MDLGCQHVAGIFSIRRFLKGHGMSFRSTKTLCCVAFVLYALPVFAQSKEDSRKPQTSEKKEEKARVVKLKAIRSSDGVTFVSWEVVPFEHRWKLSSFKILSPGKATGPRKVGCTFCDKESQCTYGCLVSGKQFITRTKTSDRLVLEDWGIVSQKYRREIAVVDSSSTSLQISKAWRSRFSKSLQQLEKKKGASDALSSVLALSWAKRLKTHLKETSLESLLESSWLIDSLWDSLRAYRARKKMFGPERLNTLDKGYPDLFKRNNGLPRERLSRSRLELQVALLESKIRILEVKQLMSERIFEGILKELKRLRAKEKDENKKK